MGGLNEVTRTVLGTGLAHSGLLFEVYSHWTPAPWDPPALGDPEEGGALLSSEGGRE